VSDPGNPSDPNSPWGTPPPGQQPGQQPGWGAPPPGYGQQQPGWGQPQQQPGWGQQQPGYGAPPGYGYGAPQTDGKAIGALICAIASFVVCPFVTAIVGLILAGQSARSIAASGGRLTGEGMVTAARVISWINIALSVLFLVFVLIAVASVPNDEFSLRVFAGLR
jgi:hypothetical protein